MNPVDSNIGCYVSGKIVVLDQGLRKKFTTCAGQNIQRRSGCGEFAVIDGQVHFAVVRFCFKRKIFGLPPSDRQIVIIPVSVKELPYFKADVCKETVRSLKVSSECFEKTERVTLKSNETKRISMRVDIPSDIPAGQSEIGFTVELDGETQEMSALILR